MNPDGGGLPGTGEWNDVIGRVYQAVSFLFLKLRELFRCGTNKSFIRDCNME